MIKRLMCLTLYKIVTRVWFIVGLIDFDYGYGLHRIGMVYYRRMFTSKCNAETILMRALILAEADSRHTSISIVIESNRKTCDTLESGFGVSAAIFTSGTLDTKSGKIKVQIATLQMGRK